MAALVPIKVNSNDHNVGLVIKDFDLNYFGPKLDKVSAIYFNFENDDQSTMQCMNYALTSSRVHSKRVNAYVSESIIDLFKRHMPTMYNYVFKIDFQRTVPHVIVTNFVNQTFKARLDLNVQLQIRAINLKFNQPNDRTFDLVPDEHSFPPPSYEDTTKNTETIGPKPSYTSVTTSPNSWMTNTNK